VNEHESEPLHGLPELLPEGERMLWQGAPEWRPLARRAFHVRSVALYFAVLIALHAGTQLADGTSLAQTMASAAWLVPLALTALGILVTLAWLVARTTVYTITDRRVVMRVGVVLTVTFNIPFRTLKTAALRLYGDGTGDLPLALATDDRISYLHLWPHVRPWRVSKTEPMLRAIPDAAIVSDLLARAVIAAEGSSVRPVRRSSPASALPPSQSRPLATAQ